MISLSRIILILSAGFYAATASAQDNWSLPQLSFSGYGTLGVVHMDEDRADYTNNAATVAPSGAGYSEDFSFAVDSRLAGQLTATFSNNFKAVVQGIVEQNAHDKYPPTIEWAYLEYSPIENLNIRVGRTLLPVFLVSDYRKVGYANPWVRPPVEVYSQVPIFNNDGVTLSYKFHSGDFTHTFGALYGKKRIKLINEGVARAKHTKDLYYGLEYAHLTFHATYHEVQVALLEFLPFAPIHLYALGANYDPGPWFVTGEWIRNKSPHLGDNDAWYISAGYRMGAFTPYATFSRLEALNQPGLGFAPLGQKNTSVGVRWDFRKDFAFKLQYEYINLDSGSIGTLANVQPDFKRGGTVNVVSAAIDFVF